MECNICFKETIEFESRTCCTSGNICKGCHGKLKRCPFCRGALESSYGDCISKNNLTAFKQYLILNRYRFKLKDSVEEDIYWRNICSCCINYNRVKFIEYILHCVFYFSNRLIFTFPLSLERFFKHTIERDRYDIFLLFLKKYRMSDHDYINLIEYTIQHNRYIMMKRLLLKLRCIKESCNKLMNKAIEYKRNDLIQLLIQHGASKINYNYLKFSIK
jgi:hypothetical protein